MLLVRCCRRTAERMTDFPRGVAVDSALLRQAHFLPERFVMQQRQTAVCDLFRGVCAFCRAHVGEKA